jgi:hypothetical protein
VTRPNLGHADSPGRFPQGPAAAQGPKRPWARPHHARVVARVEGPLTSRDSVGSVPVWPGRASGLSEPWRRTDPPGAQEPAGSSWKLQRTLKPRAHAVSRRGDASRIRARGSNRQAAPIVQWPGIQAREPGATVGTVWILWKLTVTTGVETSRALNRQQKRAKNSCRYSARFASLLCLTRQLKCL